MPSSAAFWTAAASVVDVVLVGQRALYAAIRGLNAQFVPLQHVSLPAGAVQLVSSYSLLLPGLRLYRSSGNV
jgi:hypothetical protein